MAQYTKTTRETRADCVLLTHYVIDSAAAPDDKKKATYSAVVEHGDLTADEAARVIRTETEILR